MSTHEFGYSIFTLLLLYFPSFPKKIYHCIIPCMTTCLLLLRCLFTYKQVCFERTRETLIARESWHLELEYLTWMPNPIISYWNSLHWLFRYNERMNSTLIEYRSRKAISFPFTIYLLLFDRWRGWYEYKHLKQWHTNPLSHYIQKHILLINVTLCYFHRNGSVTSELNVSHLRDQIQLKATNRKSNQKN